MNKIYLDILSKAEMIDAREKAYSALYKLKQCCLEAKQPIKQNYFVDSSSTGA